MPSLRKIASAEVATWENQRPCAPVSHLATSAPPSAPNDLHARGVARALGKGSDLRDVLLWMQDGALTAYNRGGGCVPRWQIPRAALLRFLANEDYWMSWSVEQIADDTLRAEAARLRADKPGWITLEAAVTLFNVRSTVILTWIRQHDMPAVRYRSGWWIRANAQETWHPPILPIHARHAAPALPAADDRFGGAAPTASISASERELLITWSRADVSVEEQAERLGYPLASLEPHWLELQRAGLIPLRKATRGPDWGPKHLTMLRRLVQAGLSYAEIAIEMGRTPAAIRIACRRQNMRLLQAAGVYTAREVAARMGVSCAKTVAHWITDGMLVGRNGGRTDRPLWRIQRDDLMAFMAEPLYWMAWRIERITDPYLRAFAEQLRSVQPAWYTPGQVAKHYGAGPNTPQQWIERGFIPSQRWGNHWIHQSVLSHWAPPGQAGIHSVPLDPAVVQAAIARSRQHAQQVLEQFRAGAMDDTIEQAA